MESPTEIPNRQFLSFYVAGQEYALGILQVREIIEYGVVTRVPATPTWIRGVFNLRGGVVPVVDLAVKFGLPAGEITSRTCIIVVEADLGGETTLMGIVADAVSQVMELRPEDIEAPPPFGTRVRLEYLLGMARADKRFVLLLDIDKILASDELLHVQDAAQTVEASSAAGLIRAVAEAEPRAEGPIA
jgi:purine-binding chemotaxis protein CheW